MNYIEHEFKAIEDLMDRHETTLEERSSQKEFYSELHRLLDTKYIVYHQEFVEFKGAPEYKRMSEKSQDFKTRMMKETSDRYKMELGNYEKNRSIDESLHKALDGICNSGKVSPTYAFILKCHLTFDWEDSKNLENARQTYNHRKKFR